MGEIYLQIRRGMQPTDIAMRKKITKTLDDSKWSH